MIKRQKENDRYGLSMGCNHSWTKMRKRHITCTGFGTASGTALSTTVARIVSGGGRPSESFCPSASEGKEKSLIEMVLVSV